ncbi:hypothetical protein BGX38DRAFT_1273224 [Terfezia claveryi]|nr:hypothetical protein BGX38DRAFT_1273224 [Terfezia claveryi]
MPKKTYRSTKHKPAAFKLRASNNAGAAGNKAPARKRPQNTLIIGIDFGTTFSGVAWYNLASNKTHHNRDWPGQEKSSDKVPSVLRYNSKGSYKWGNIPTELSNNRLEWFKLLLNEGNYTTPAELLQRLEAKGLKGYPESKPANFAKLRTTIKAIPEGKTPVDLTADYFKSLYKCVQSRIEESIPALKEQLGNDGGVTIKCCLTVPAIWDDKAKQITKQAAIAAGLLEKQIYMISEPEAAAVHCLTSLCEMGGNLKTGEVYVIVDCGGGTVDLIPYEVTSTSPLQVSECTIGTGGLCGSTILDRRFEDLVIFRIGQEAYDGMDDDDQQVMRNDFEMEIKPKFLPGEADDNDDELDDDNCVICALPGVPDSDDPTVRVKKGKIKFSKNELKGIFESTFTEIAELVQKQVKMAQEATKKNVDGIILVGGFGSSEYLANWLEDSIRNKDGTEIKLIRPPDPAASIVLGAVKHGVYMHRAGTGKTSQWGIVGSRRARYHYGIKVAEPFKPGHRHNKRVIDPHLGIPICVDRMKWLIQKGAPIREQVGIPSQFSCRCPIVDSEEAQKALLVFEQKIYCSAEDTAPEYLEDLDIHPGSRYPLPLLTYKIDLSDPQSREHFIKLPSVMSFSDYWLIPAQILLKLESADLTFTTLVEGMVSGKGTKEYHHKESGELLQAPMDGSVLEVDVADEDNQDEHGIEVELGRLELDD